MNSFIRAALLSLASVGVVACSLPLSDAAPKVTNTCTSNAECGANGVCTTTDGGKVCAATQASVGPVILEVRPASDVKGDTVSHVFTDKLTLSGAYPSGALPNVDLQIPTNATFEGELILPAGTEACAADDGSVPVRVELHSVSVYSNLSSIYKADTTLVQDGTGSSYRYSLQVPTGTADMPARYDVYLSPTTPTCAGATSLLPAPPVLISGVEVTGNTEFKPDWPTPLKLNGSVVFPAGTDVSNWKVEVVDPDYGLVLSDSGSLGIPQPGTGESALGVGTNPKSVIAGIRYSYKKGAIIRLTAPDGKLVVHWSLDALDPTMVKLSLADLLATTNSVEASVVDQAKPPNPIAASVRIRSLTLTGNANQNASFRVDTETDASGKIHAELIPGLYQVSISPKISDGTSATLVDTWDLRQGNLGHGHAFVLPERPKLRGEVTSPSGAPLSQISVLASPVANTQSYVSTAFDVGDVQPRNALAQTDSFGSFQMLVDPGTVDFSLQPTADTGFSWLIIPNLLVGDATQKPIADLATLSIPSPVLVSGSVSSTQGAVPSAVVRAWVAVPTDPTMKTSSAPTTLLQIGETVSDDTGRFVLPLPPTISFSTPQP